MQILDELALCGYSVGGDELCGDMSQHRRGSETAEIEVEVGVGRYEFADLKTDASFTQPVHRLAAGRVGVARDIESA